jgi:hypothetical protein
VLLLLAFIKLFHIEKSNQSYWRERFMRMSDRLYRSVEKK